MDHLMSLYHRPPPLFSGPSQVPDQPPGDGQDRHRDGRVPHIGVGRPGDVAQLPDHRPGERAQAEPARAGARDGRARPHAAGEQRHRQGQGGPPPRVQAAQGRAARDQVPRDATDRRLLGAGGGEHRAAEADIGAEELAGQRSRRRPIGKV